MCSALNTGYKSKINKKMVLFFNTVYINIFSDMLATISGYIAFLKFILKRSDSGL
jgi:hypothetical protein